METSRRGAESRRQEAEVRLTEGANESARRASSQYVGDRGSGRRLWITDGVKKADSLTSRGACVISLTGVFKWRSQLGTLGDWEDVLLKSRNVVICFDADARTNPNALRAMVRLGRWLKSRDTKKVWYLTVPAEINGKPVKGADDFLAAGGTLEELKAARTTTEPNPDVADDTFTDARLAETIADDVLADRFMWVSRLGWLGWDGRRWAEATDVQVAEAIRQYGLDRFAEAMKDNRNSQGSKETVNGWHSMLGAGRMRSVLALARGIVERKADELDAEPDLLNTPSGVVDLQTGVLSQHNPAWLMTKITSGSFRPGFTHPDWDKALEALPRPEREYFQTRTDQSITGHRTPDGKMPVLQGAGENGKSLLTTDGLVPALGDYALVASPKLFQFSKGSEHSEERATLRGRRLLIAEELTEGRSIDVTALKQIQDVGVITARHVFQKNMTFRTTHSLFTTTNQVWGVSSGGVWPGGLLVPTPRAPVTAPAEVAEVQAENAVTAATDVTVDVQEPVLTMSNDTVDTETRIDIGAVGGFSLRSWIVRFWFRAVIRRRRDQH